GERPAVRVDQSGAAGGLQDPEPDLVLVGAQVQDEIVELAGQGQRPEGAPGLVDRRGVRRRRRARPADGDLGEAARPVDVARDVAVADAIAVDRALERGQGDAPRARRPVGARRGLPGAAAWARGLQRARGGSWSTSPDSTARAPLIPSSTVQKKSARSRRTRRLSTSRVSPPVPGSTASSGTSGSDTAVLPSSAITIQSVASASS